MEGALLKGTAILLNDGFFYELKKGEYETFSAWLRDDGYYEFADKVRNKGNSIKFLAVKYSNQIKKGKNYMNFLEKFDEQITNSNLKVLEGTIEWKEIYDMYNASGLRNSCPSRDIQFIEFVPGDDDNNGLSIKCFRTAKKLDWFGFEMPPPTIETEDYHVEQLVT